MGLRPVTLGSNPSASTKQKQHILFRCAVFVSLGVNWGSNGTEKKQTALLFLARGSSGEASDACQRVSGKEESQRLDKIP